MGIAKYSTPEMNKVKYDLDDNSSDLLENVGTAVLAGACVGLLAMFAKESSKK